MQQKNGKENPPFISNLRTHSAWKLPEVHEEENTVVDICSRPDLSEF